MAAAELIECRRRAGGLRERLGGRGERHPSVGSLGFCAEVELALGTRFGMSTFLDLVYCLSENLSFSKVGSGR